MTLDAMDWVWKHSQSKGNARLALLYVADQVRDSACKVRLSYADFLEALNTTSRTTVSKAIAAAERLGELKIDEGGSGRRAPLYLLPKAAGYVRSALRSGPETGLQASRSGPETGPLGTEAPSASGPESGPQDFRSGPDSDASGPETGLPLSHTHNPPTNPGGAEGRQGDAVAVCQPLIDAMTDAGIVVSWQMSTEQWTNLVRVVNRAGVDAMVRFAVATKKASRQEIRFASFFLRSGWLGLPPQSTRSRDAPVNGVPRQQLPHCGECDPDTRLREVLRDGLPELTPCPECHPVTQGAHT